MRDVRAFRADEILQKMGTLSVELPVPSAAECLYTLQKIIPPSLFVRGGDVNTPLQCLKHASVRAS